MGVLEQTGPVVMSWHYCPPSSVTGSAGRRQQDLLKGDLSSALPWSPQGPKLFLVLSVHGASLIPQATPLGAHRSKHL